ncbi:MAG: glycosyltransferase family 4 protein [Acidimicrobiales bacterium]|nr:glycosyltransferase family 4 protein [Acidimicrobiales bacterium]
MPEAQPATVMKIGLVTDCYVPRLGGIEMQVHDLGQRLREAGHEVVVVTPTPGPDVVDGVPVHRMDVPLAPFDIPYKPSSFDRVIELLEAEAVDVAHFHGGIVSPLAFVSAHHAVQRRIPTVITTHCLWSYATPVFRLLERRYRWSEWDAVFSAVSEVAAAPIRRIAPNREVLILPNGIDNRAWEIDPSPRDPDRVVIVSVMRLAPRKRPLQLLKMFKRVRQRVPSNIDLRLVIIGEGPERKSMERYVAAQGLSDAVELTGRLSREQIREVYATADIFVAPANLESFGIAALEARCAGLPVVAKARTGIREFVDHGQEGLLADSDADMVDQLVTLVLDRELRGKITARNREIPSPVDWTEVVSLNLDAYQKARELVGASAVGPPRSRIAQR